MECLHKDPFLRPTASSLAQRLFDLVVLRAANVAGGGQQNLGFHPLGPDLNDLVHLIIAKVREKREIQSNAQKIGAAVPMETQFKVDEGKFASLLRAAQGTDPLISFVVGLAHLWNLVEIAEDAQDAICTRPLEGAFGHSPTSFHAS
jgi:hypothetical protein